MTCSYSSALPCKLPLQEMFIYDSAGKEIFADHVPHFVRALLCDCCPLMSITVYPPCSGSTHR